MVNLNLSEKVQAKIAMAQHLEDQGNVKDAEKTYLEAIKLLSDSDKNVKGMIYIDLGNMFSSVKKFDKVIEYYKKAVEQYVDAKGDGMIQLAHANFNLAKAYLFINDKNAANCSQKALELYKKYPFTPTNDKEDAEMLHFVCLALKNAPIDKQAIMDLFQRVTQNDYSGYDSFVAPKFATLVVKINNGNNSIIEAVNQWGKGFIEIHHR